MSNKPVEDSDKLVDWSLITLMQNESSRGKCAFKSALDRQQSKDPTTHQVTQRQFCTDMNTGVP